MLKSTLRKIENIVIDHFNGDQITIVTDENLVSMTIINDSEKDRIISVKIDTCEDTVSISVSHKIIESEIEIYFTKIGPNSVEFHPISDEIDLPDDLVDLIYDEINFPLYPTYLK